MTLIFRLTPWLWYTLTKTFYKWKTPEVCKLELFIFLTFQLMWYMMIWPWPSCTLTFDFLFQEAVSRMGGIDILILNHILPIPLGMWEGSPQNLTITDKIVDVNFKAYVHLTSHALPHLVASNGSVIVVSSLAGLVILLFLLFIF